MNNFSITTRGPGALGPNICITTTEFYNKTLPYILLLTTLILVTVGNTRHSGLCH